MDDEAIVSADRLEEAVEAVLGIVDILERDMRMQRQFKGLVALSNPKYDLYISPGTPCMKSEVPASAREWNHLMNCIVRHFDGESSILDVAEKYDIEFALVRDYVEKFEQRGLIRFL